jgi:glucose/mannose transport system substrate-binding protein
MYRGLINVGKKKKSMLLAGAAVMSLGLVTACGSSSSTGTSNNTTTGGAKTNQVQVFSWWTAGGEADGLKALLDVYAKQFPDQKVVNEAVAGGAGSNAKAVLSSRMQAGNPPDSFQVHAGEELMAWVKAGDMQPLDDLYQKEGWNSVFPKGMIDGVSYQGHIYAIPVDIHRGNVLWYNPAVLKKYNLQAPKTMDDLLQDAKVLKSHGVTPIALGDKDQWESTMLWENVLLGSLGYQKYDDLWQGKVKFTDPSVKQATETFKQLLQYVNTNHSALTWDNAAQLVADGTGAFNLMGDWAKGYYTSKNLKPGTDFGWTTMPGTSDDFEYISDAFGLPKGAPNATGAKDFLTLLGSKEGQDVFNPKKGSIPARTDGDKSLFDEYSQGAMTDFGKDNLVPSLAHGEAANPAFLTSANQAINVFVSDGNVDELLQSLDSAAQQNPLS